ncbi:hypothetical protein DIS24_g1950 [Lasiodiplodia hormozganensis]|uniref:Uncharacterized protein n=1 Tax=Lasiodiplodia hormozganensis TaxID=869390 RepID=A0AA39Z1D7_9PEZI|nr:hypothetical protein DIS24_g1950 [Lasiodiplodia hormozganensis]
MAISTIPLPLSIRPSTSSSTSSSSSLLPPTPTTPNRQHYHHHQPTYIRSGIGGAGNWHKASSIPPPPPPHQSPVAAHHHRDGGFDNNFPTTPSSPLLATPTTTTTAASPYPPLNHTPLRTTSSTHFKSGIGGAGNTHPLTARSVLGFDEELARCRAVERRLPAAYPVGIGGAGNFRCREAAVGYSGSGMKRRLRPQRSAGALGGAGGGMMMRMKRSEGDLRVEAAEAGREAVPRAMVEVVVGSDGGCEGGVVKRVSWGDDSVEEFEADGYEGDNEAERERECVYYSNEPLPYGALDVLRRRLERAFASRRGGAREVLASPKDKGIGAVLVGSEGERRGLRSHRSMWRF